MPLEIASGPWAATYDGETLSGIESAEPKIDTNTADISSIDGNQIKKVTGRSASVVLTVFDTGITNLKKFLPDAWIAAGTQIEGQETGVVAKTGEAGAITFGKPACGTAELTAPLQLVPCEDPDNHTVTLFDGVAEITDIKIEDGVLRYEITISSQAVGVQMAKGAITFPA